MYIIHCIIYSSTIIALRKKKLIGLLTVLLHRRPGLYWSVFQCHFLLLPKVDLFFCDRFAFVMVQMYQVLFGYKSEINFVLSCGQI